VSAVNLAGEFEGAAEELLVHLRAGEWEDGFSPTDWAAAGEAGWFDILRAETDGGLGLGLPELGGIFRAVGRNLFAGPLLEHAVAVPIVEAAGGHVEGMVALVDSPAHGVRFADRAETFLVLADDSVAIVPAAVVTVAPHASLDPSVSYADVMLAEARPQQVVSLDVPGLRGALRLMLACEIAGLADRTLELAVEYAKVREQFGRPIGGFQAVQHLLAEMARRRHALDALCRSAVHAAPDALPLAGSVAKAAAAANGRAIVEGSLQVHGGIAFTIEHVLHRYYKHLLGLEQLFGGSRELESELGHMLLERGAEPWPCW
jgi:acyl-CoA dehydrogenase